MIKASDGISDILLLLMLIIMNLKGVGTNFMGHLIQKKDKILKILEGKKTLLKCSFNTSNCKLSAQKSSKLQRDIIHSPKMQFFLKLINSQQYD